MNLRNKNIKLLLKIFSCIFIITGLLLLPEFTEKSSYAADRRLAKYGVERTINFEVFEVDGVDFRVDWTPAQADCEIMKDEGISTACTNTASDEGSTYSIVLTATEMQAARLVLKLADAATKVFLDKVVVIETYGNASALHAFDLDTASVAQSADNDTKISTLITGVELNADAITSAKIADNAIATEHIATGAITADSIAADAIGASELAANAIGASEIATDAIGAAEIAADAIGTAEIANDAITATEIAANAIGASELAADAIGSSELATTAVDEIADGNWDELMAGHVTADTSGLVMNDWQDAGRLDAIQDIIAADVVNLDGSAMIGTNNAALASVCTEGRLAELDAGNLPSTTDDTLTDTAQIGVAGAGLSNINLPNQTMDIVGDITGNLSGSVGSVTGAVGSVTGSVGSVAGNVDGSIGSLGATAKTDVNTEVDNALDTALPASPTTGSINDILDRQEETIVNGAAVTGTLSTTEMTTDLTVTVNDQFNGRIITFRKDTATASLRGQQTDITDTVTTNGKLTFTAITTAPANGDTFEIN